jgi:hypothetical protein
MKKKSYEKQIADLEHSRPHVAQSLIAAHSNRQRRLARLSASGLRLTGLEELLSYLSSVEEAFNEHKRLSKIAFLVARTRLDFETAIEATMSGIHSVVFDAMRDVMEIELLLIDFGLEPKHVDEWLNADARTLQRQFSPGALRSRYARALKVAPQDVEGYADYKGHSMFLHVTPRNNPFGNKGITTMDDAFLVDSCFWDIFEHARRIIRIVHLVRRRLAPQQRTGPNPMRSLKDVRQAWRATQEMKDFFFFLAENRKQTRRNNHKAGLLPVRDQG